MSRQPRLNIADGVYHVTQRGLEKRRIVIDDQDRREWLRLFHRQATRFGWRVFADALLDNHFHIFLRTPQPNLSTGMQAFESGYVTYFNKQHPRVGPLFQGRFGAVLVEFESHARVLSRYVHLNPVEAGLARTPGEYAWSSYRYYLDPQGAPRWLDWRTILSEISTRESAARIAYRRFVEAGLGTPLPNPLDDAVDGWLLGSSRFVARYQDCQDWGQALRNSELAESGVEHDRDDVPPIPNSEVPDPEALLRAVAAEFGVTREQQLARGRHQNHARLAALWLCRELLHESLGQLGIRFGGLQPSTVSEALQKAARLMAENAEFRRAVERAGTVGVRHFGISELAE